MGIDWQNGATNEIQYCEVDGVKYRLEFRHVRSKNPHDEWLVFKAGEDSPPIVGASSQKLAKQYFREWLEKKG